MSDHLKKLAAARDNWIIDTQKGEISIPRPSETPGVQLWDNYKMLPDVGGTHQLTVQWAKLNDKTVAVLNVRFLSHSTPHQRLRVADNDQELFNFARNLGNDILHLQKSPVPDNLKFN